MQISFRLSWKHAVGTVLLVLVLANIGRLYQREGEKHTLVFVGTRHVWRYAEQATKDGHWFTDRPRTLARQFAGLEKPYIIPQEQTAAGCIAAFKDRYQVSLLLDMCGARDGQ